MRLSEAANKQVAVIYPGRFQPFHKGHKAVYDYLSKKYNGNVYVATSDKVDPPRSPFSFEEKKKMMELTGMDTDKVVLTKSPYVATEITQNFDKENTILFFAVSAKDMAEDPRFTFKPKKDGSPSYFQNAKDGNFETMDKHAYMITVPTFEFEVLGKPMASATEVRAQFAKADETGKKHIIRDLFGKYSPAVMKLMRAKVLESRLNEGGWTDAATQQTTLTPAIVKAGLAAVQEFIVGFNKWLTDRGHGPVEIGAATGSSAYHDVDDEDMEYGDIDLQMVVDDIPDLTGYQVGDLYNKLTDQYIEETKPALIYMPGQPAHGHPIFNIGSDKVQIDLMWAARAISDWARWRKTPQRGVKGLITGNMFSSLGEVLRMSIQGDGVQMKTMGGDPVSFNKRKGTELHVLSTDIENFGVDILKAFYQGEHGTLDGIKVDPELKSYPGLKKSEVKVTDLAHTVKGLAKSFELNGLFGKWGLENYSSAEELTDAFVMQHLKKADAAIKSPKFDKAVGPEGIAKAKKVKAHIAAGADIVRKAFNESAQYGTDHNRIFGGIEGDIVDATKAIEELFAKVQNTPQGTKVRQRLYIKLQNAIRKLKRQMEINLELRENQKRDKELNENKKMSAQKLGVFAKGSAKVSLWEHDGTVVLIDNQSKRLQESKGSVKEAINALYNRGYICESMEMHTLKNQKGAILNVFHDTIRKQTTVRDKEGGSHTYPITADKVLKALGLKGYEPTTGRGTLKPEEELFSLVAKAGEVPGGGHEMNLMASRRAAQQRIRKPHLRY
jgi:hypothetical protein